MVTTYEEALNWVHSRLRLGIKPGLKRMEWMMEKLGNPEKEIKAIHIAGTNGKGSTVCYLRNMLEEAGYCVGTFTSPYFEIFNERISVNGKPINNDELLDLVNLIIPLSDELAQTDLGAPSEFEVITAMAFYYFANHKQIDYVIFETGLGGRLDSTNIVTPLVSVITNIGYDHMSFLGDTLEEIAAEKAGIIKPNIPVMSSVEQPDAKKVIDGRAKELLSSIFLLEQDFFITNHEPRETGEQFSLRTPFQMYQDLEITMKGAHQVKNAALATMTITYLKQQNLLSITDEAVRAGLKKAKWIGRFEQVSTNPTIILDGAHNPEGVASLVETVKTHLTGKKIHVIFAGLKDKKLDHMIEQLSEIADSMTFTSFDFPRVASARELYDTCQFELKTFEENWKKAINHTINQLNNDEVLLITGSLYFLSGVRPYILEKGLES